jgi:hypothetical protein
VCGDTAVTIALGIASEVEVTSSMSWIAQSPNTRATRRDAIFDASAEIHEAIDGGSARAAQFATKRALEAIHELNDGLGGNRREWSQDGWSDDDLALWHAHLGARQAAHHSSCRLVALHSDGAIDDRLTWAIDEAGIKCMNSSAQQRNYRELLASKPVLPALRQIAARVDSSVT